jgi:hypothetical protein
VKQDLEDRTTEDPGRFAQEPGQALALSRRVPEIEAADAELMAEIEGGREFPDRVLPGENLPAGGNRPGSLEETGQSVPADFRRRPVEKMKDAPGTEQFQIRGVGVTGLFGRSAVVDLEKFMTEGPDFTLLDGSEHRQPSLLPEDDAMGQGRREKNSKDNPEKNRGAIGRSNPNQKIDIDGQYGQLARPQGKIEFRQPPEIGGTSLDPTAVNDFRSRLPGLTHRKQIRGLPDSVKPDETFVSFHLPDILHPPGFL